MLILAVLGLCTGTVEYIAPQGYMVRLLQAGSWRVQMTAGITTYRSWLVVAQTGKAPKKHLMKDI
jgi:hypothetical protein